GVGRWRGGAGMGMRVLLGRADVPPARHGWLSLLVGVALVEAVRRVSEVDAYLKWPNDLLLPGDRKCGGILAESAGGAVVVGIGLKTSLRGDELPRPGGPSPDPGGPASYDPHPLPRPRLRPRSA